MPPLDRCDTSFGKLNTHVVKNLSESASIPANSLLAYTTPSNKYDVDHFPTLSELNDELRGRFVDHNPVLDNICQSGTETLSKPCKNITNKNRMSINFEASVQNTSQCTHHSNSSW